MTPDFVNEQSAGYLQVNTDAIVNFQAAWEAANPTSLLAAGQYMFLFQCENTMIRWRDDGVNPTTLIGMPLGVNSQLIYTGRIPQNLRFIGSAAGGTLNVCGWKVR